jgi:hypothetical protein
MRLDGKVAVVTGATYHGLIEWARRVYAEVAGA